MRRVRRRQCAAAVGTEQIRDPSAAAPRNDADIRFPDRPCRG